MVIFLVSTVYQNLTMDFHCDWDILNLADLCWFCYVGNRIQRWISTEGGNLSNPINLQ